ncbi:MAG: ABC transporter ATP-binding protein [Saprospiraceae bacterium]
MQAQKSSAKIPSRESLREALRIFQFVRPYRGYFIAGLILLALSSSIFMIFPYVVGLMLDVAQGARRLYDMNLGKIGLLLILVLAFQGLVSYFRVMAFAHVSERATADIRNATYARLVSLPIVFFEKNRVGDLVSRLTNDIEKIYNTLYFILAEFIRQIILLAGGIAFLAWQTPKLAGIMLATFPLIVVGAMIFGRYIRKLSRSRQDALAQTNTILDETLQSIYAVKAYTNELFESRRYAKTNAGVVKISLRYAGGRALFAVFIILMLFGALFFVIWTGMNMVQNGEITAGQLISFVTFTAVIGGAIAGLGNFYTELVGAVGATERVREILRAAPEDVGPVSEAGAGAPLAGDIRFEDVHFAYPTRADVPVLRGIDLHIPPGAQVALVGQSGAGKSTIMQLLLRLHHPDSGRILADGLPIDAYPLSAYRSNFAIVPQDVILFGGSIRDNIRYGRPDATEQEIIEAAREANAWEFISTFPEGLDTVVGERGVKLSGGQRQRIAIARAILRNPAILLLDEATSSLDAESERVVQDALQRLMRGRTSIVIAHRLATIRNADYIYVLEGGRIVEAGTHRELSAIENGAYSSLAKLQFKIA